MLHRCRMYTAAAMSHANSNPPRLVYGVSVATNMEVERGRDTKHKHGNECGEAQQQSVVGRILVHTYSYTRS